MQMLASMTWGQWLVALLIIVICCFFMLVILLQRGRGGGLAGAFGGAGGSSAFGAKTGDVFTWITVVVAAVLLVVCVVANFVMEPLTDAEILAADTTASSVPDPAAPSDGTAPVQLPEGVTVVPVEVPSADDSPTENPTGDGNALPGNSAESTGAEESAKPEPEGAGDAGGSGGDSKDPSTP